MSNNPIIVRMPSNTPGPTGKSAYQAAVDLGYVGTEAEWIASLEGTSAYEAAVALGFVGTEAEWITSLEGASAYEVAVANGYVGDEASWLLSLKGDQGDPGNNGATYTLLTADLTVTVGPTGDYATIKDAFEYVYATYRPAFKSPTPIILNQSSGYSYNPKLARVTIELQGTYVWEEHLQFYGGDLSWITLTSAGTITVNMDNMNNIQPLMYVAYGTGPVVMDLELGFYYASGTGGFVPSTRVFYGVGAKWYLGNIHVGSEVFGSIFDFTDCDVVLFGYSATTGGANAFNQYSPSTVRGGNLHISQGAFDTTSSATDIEVTGGAVVRSRAAGVGYGVTAAYSIAVNTLTPDGLIFEY